MGDALMSEPVIYVAKIMAQSADAATNSIHENLQQAVGQQKSHAAKVRKVVIEGLVCQLPSS